MNPTPEPTVGRSPRLKEFLQRWAITTVAVVVAERIIPAPGIHFDHWRSLAVATLILAALNMVLRPLMVAASVGLMAAFNLVIGVRMAILTLPVQILFFGFLLLAINAGLLMAVAKVVPSFSVAGFWPAFWGGVVISLATLFLNSLTRSGNARITVRRGGPPGTSNSPRNRGRDGDDGPRGPIIDV